MRVQIYWYVLFIGGDASEAGVLHLSIPGLERSSDKNYGTDIDPCGTMFEEWIGKDSIDQRD